MLEEYLLDIGYSDKDIKKINKFFQKTFYSEATILYNFRNLERFFKRNHINNQEFIYITLTVPNILTLGIENINSKIKSLSLLGFNKIDFFSILKKYPYFIELNLENIQSKIDIFSGYSFANEDVVSIFVRLPDLLKIDNEILKNHFLFLKKVGYNTNEIRHMILIEPKLLLENEYLFSDQIQQLKKIGFMDDDILKITFFVPGLLLHFFDTIQNKFQFLIKFGFSEIDIIQMIKKVPLILEKQVLSSMDKKLTTFKQLGFNKNQVIFMCCKNPYILLYSEDRISIRFYELIDLGFIKEDTINLLYTCPILFGYRFLNLKNKISFFQENGLFSIIKEYPNSLLYNIDFIKNRYLYINNNVETISINNYHLLFLSDSDFYKKYNISNIELLKGN